MSKIERREVQGMPIYIHSDTESSLVGVGIRVAAGSMHELPEEEGAAHYLEHIIFKGSQNMRPHEFIQLSDELALQDNAYTCQNHTYYHFVSLPAVLEKGFASFLDCIKNPALREDEIERERNVILEEIKMRDTNSGLVSYEQMQNQMYPDHPYSRMIPGTLETLAALPAKALRDFHSKHYRRENVSFFFSGNITPETAVRFVEEMAVFEPGAPTYAMPAVPVLAPSVKHTERPEEKVCSSLYATRLNLKGDLAAMAPYRLLRTVLAGGMSAPLFFRIREQEGLVYSITASVDATPLGMEFYFDWNSRYSNVERVHTLAMEELNKIAEGNITEEQLEVARRKILMGALSRNQSTNGQLNEMLNYQNAYGRCYEDSEVTEIYNSITVEEVVAAAKELQSQEWVLSTVGGSNN